MEQKITRDRGIVAREGNTMGTHTPGPWIVGARRKEDNAILLTTNHERETKRQKLAYVAPCPHYDDRQAANARLIAAAPELLEACKALMSYMLDEDSTEQIAIDAIQTAKAAIAKAEDNS